MVEDLDVILAIWDELNYKILAIWDELNYKFFPNQGGGFRCNSSHLRPVKLQNVPQPWWKV